MKRTAAGNANLANRKQAAMEKYLDKIVPTTNDPFDDGDDDLDVDYIQPSPKKLKAVEAVDNLEQRKKRPKGTNKKLTPKERIERLKRKTNFVVKHQYNKTNAETLVNVTTISLQSETDSPANRNSVEKQSLIESRKQTNHDSFFNNFDSNANENDHTNFPPSKMIQMNNFPSNGIEHRDAYVEQSITDFMQKPSLIKSNKNGACNFNEFDANANGNRRKNPGEMSTEKKQCRDKNANSSTANISKHLFDQQSVHIDIRKMLESFIGKFGELHTEVLALRKQLARVEAKMIQNPRESQSSQSDDTVFLDYEQSLAQEGLPVKSIDGVNSLERKLKDAAYRQRLVRSQCSSSSKFYILNEILI